MELRKEAGPAALQDSGGIGGRNRLATLLDADICSDDTVLSISPSPYNPLLSPDTEMPEEETYDGRQAQLLSWRVWVKHETEVWTTGIIERSVAPSSPSAEVDAFPQSTYVVRLEGGREDEEEETLYIRVEDLHLWDPTHALDLDNAASMNALHEAPLLHMLRRRHAAGRACTDMSDVLLSINPYTKTPGLYDSHRGGSNGAGGAALGPAYTPHVHVLARRAYDDMAAACAGQGDRVQTHWGVRDQSIVVSGESGCERRAVDRCCVFSYG
ncbi:hypothetical protein JKP88DRAFT_254727 [Tribonema minus]|uniref:Myosin motor domain-containing protein n=1 Tax=Tribonema minus TaxID=303371 RepID=A0A835Z3L9_9STRA|nr:hypothetical protein JKP88DRAFT_254727 [Tribonema minus]